MNYSRTNSRRKLILISLFALFFLSCGTSELAEEPENELAVEQPPEHGEDHADHDPRHGGIFFMAFDYRHHLEGALVEPGIFRVYLYTAQTDPVSLEQLKKAKASVYWGWHPDPPGLELTAREDGTALEATLDREIEFPLTLTLLIEFPDSEPGTKPELFNFEFEGFSVEPEGHTQHEGSMH